MRFSAGTILFALLIVCLVVPLKLYYGAAAEPTPDEPIWLLAPTAKFLNLSLPGLDFRFVAGTGYVSADGRLVLDRGCSGLNFFVICLLLGGVSPLLSEVRRWRLLRVGLVVLLAALPFTVFANVSRVLALLVFARLVPQVLHPGVLHLAVGTFVYLIFLLLFSSLLRLTTRAAKLSSE